VERTHLTGIVGHPGIKCWVAKKVVVAEATKNHCSPRFGGKNGEKAGEKSDVASGGKKRRTGLLRTFHRAGAPSKKKECPRGLKKKNLTFRRGPGGKLKGDQQGKEAALSSGLSTRLGGVGKPHLLCLAWAVRGRKSEGISGWGHP